MRLVVRSVTLLLLAECAAHAQTSEKALAEGLFEDGRALLESGDTSRACERFAASQKIEPKVGTLLNLATCHEKEGRSASAWAEFIEAESQATRKGQPERATFAHAHAEALGLVLSRLSFEKRGGFEGVDVWVDGVRLEKGAEGTALPVDPGERIVEVRGSGKKTWTTRVLVPAGPASMQVDVPELEPIVLTVDSPRVVASRPTPPRAEPHDTSSRRTAGLIALTVGVVGSSLGTVYGVHAILKKSEADRECTGSACSANGLAMHDDVKTSAAVATAAFTVGVAGLSAGAFLLLSGGHADTTAPPLVTTSDGRSVAFHF